MTKPLPPEILDLVRRGAMFFVNHSGGKDSQAMFAYIKRHVPASQITVIHAELPGVDWPGILEHIEATIDGAPLLVCRAIKTFEQMVERRGLWPSPSLRQCTSDLKRGPLEKVIRGTGAKLIVNCVGIRAEESASRSKADPFKFSDRNSKAGREWHDWLPIFDWTIGEVFAAIAGAGQKPHPAYAAGMSRLSCCFCIMSSLADLKTAAALAPETYARMVALEKKIDQTMLMPTKKHGRRFLEEVTGIPADGARRVIQIHRAPTEQLDFPCF
jgi:3'-phosphoadenosine 5'-phosphosulfate sulfotransferase (PAPS reductase)/FAD synthetase